MLFGSVIRRSRTIGLPMWRKRCGFGFETITQSEACYLARTADADTVRNRIAAAGQGQDLGDRASAAGSGASA
jgi:hypothetical protein